MEVILLCTPAVAIGQMQRPLNPSQPVIFPVFRVYHPTVQTGPHGALLVLARYPINVSMLISSEVIWVDNELPIRRQYFRWWSSQVFPIVPSNL